MKRIVFSACIALLVALALFELMYSLIHSDKKMLRNVLPTPLVNITPVKAPKKEQQKRLQDLPQKPVEPQVQAQIMPVMSAPQLNTSSAQVQIEVPDLSIHMASDQLQRAQQNWVQPSANAGGLGASVDYVGERDTGKREIVPYATSQPHIPKIAWDNKINGWVLVAFTVTNKGVVQDVSIMDASPRGIFEPYAISAVEGWRYSEFKGPSRYLSQKIEFLWENYPYNLAEF